MDKDSKFNWNKNIKVVKYNDKYFLTSESVTSIGFISYPDIECKAILFNLYLFLTGGKDYYTIEDLIEWGNLNNNDKNSLLKIINILIKKKIVLKYQVGKDKSNSNEKSTVNPWKTSYLKKDSIFSTPLNIPTENILNVIGIPICSISDSIGTQLAPQLARILLKEPLFSKDYHTSNSDYEGYDKLSNPVVSDLGDLECYGTPNQISERLRKIIAPIFEKNKGKLFIIGGDHSILPICGHAVFADNPFNLIHFDAHSDAYFSNTSHFNHANPINFLLDLCPNVNVFSFGLRTGIDFREIKDDVPRPDLIYKDRLNQYSINETRKIINNGNLNEIILDKSLPCYFSVDLDILNPVIFPWVSTPLQGGLNVEEFLNFFRLCVEEFNPMVLDMVELNILRSSNFNSQDISDLISLILLKFWNNKP